MSNINTYAVQSHSLAEANARFMSRVYAWMSGGILLTAIIASYVGQTPEIVFAIVTNRVLFYGLIIAQLGAVITLSGFGARLSAFATTAIYLLYAALTGLTLSVIFMVYTQESIASVFMATAAGFAGLSLFGFVTKRDLGPVGAFCGMALFGMIGFAIASFIFPSLWGETAQVAYSVIGVVVFAGLTAYDTQKIKQMNGGSLEGTDQHQTMAIHGALALYLDFINLFLNLLRLMGGRRD